MNSDDYGLRSHELKCPECRALLKRRRSHKADACERVCGGCGKIFDVCDTKQLEALQESS